LSHEGNHDPSEERFLRPDGSAVLAVNWPDEVDTPEESPLSEDEAAGGGGGGGGGGWVLAGGGGGGGGGVLAGGAEELVSVGGAELVVLVVVELSADEELVVSVDVELSLGGVNPLVSVVLEEDESVESVEFDREVELVVQL
jgi:hypothetical protein